MIFTVAKKSRTTKFYTTSCHSYNVTTVWMKDMLTYFINKLNKERERERERERYVDMA